MVVTVILYTDVTNNQHIDIGNENTAAQTLLGGLTWTALTCSAGVIGYVIGGDVGVFTGALCAIVTGVVCVDVIQSMEQHK